MGDVSIVTDIESLCDTSHESFAFLHNVSVSFDRPDPSRALPDHLGREPNGFKKLVLKLESARDADNLKRALQPRATMPVVESLDTRQIRVVFETRVSPFTFYGSAKVDRIPSLN